MSSEKKRYPRYHNDLGLQPGQDPFPHSEASQDIAYLKYGEDFPDDLYFIQEFFDSLEGEVPPGTMIAAIGFKPGSVKESAALIAYFQGAIEHQISATSARRTVFILYQDGQGDFCIVPVLNSWETKGIPHEIYKHMTKNAALAMIQAENLETAANFLDQFSCTNTIRSVPTAGSFKPPRNTKPRTRRSKKFAPSKDGIEF